MKTLLHELGATIALGSVIFLMLFLATESQGQAYAGGQLTTLDRLGYKNPIVGVNAGFAADTPWSFSQADIEFARAPKKETGNGTSFTATGITALRWRNLLLGAGLKRSAEHTSEYSKAAVRPFVLAGVETSTVRLQGRWLLSQWDTQNGLGGPEVTVEFYAGQRWSMIATGGAFRFHDTRVPGVDYGGVPASYHWGAEAGLGVRFYFWKRKELN